MNEERDRFLTEAMGACWHDWDPDKWMSTYSLTGYVCTKCGNFILGHYDYATIEDFRKLWGWATGRTEYRGLVERFGGPATEDSAGGEGLRNAFADELYRLLGGKRSPGTQKD